MADPTFTRAIVRRPSENFAAGLTSAQSGPPDVAKALQQHERYCDALRGCGLEVTIIDAAPDYPDGTFVEDTAIVTPRGAVVTRPGAESRRGEVESVAPALRKFFGHVQQITAPGTVDGGDVCEADGHYLIGLSQRTNEEGARQLAEHLRHMHYTASVVDVRGSPALLHLKSGISYLGAGRWVAAQEVRGTFESWSGLPVRELIVAQTPESYAANCVRINDAVLVPEGYPRIAAQLRDKGYKPLPLEVSEFRKMDGGLSCLSLRF